MKRRSAPHLFAILTLGLAALPTPAAAQQNSLKDQLMGTWRPVSIQSERSDGTRRDNFGPHPSGILIFDRTGHFALQVVNPDLPKHTSADRFRMTPEEYATIVKGGIAYSGTYSVDEAKRTFTIVLERSMFELWHDRTLAFEIKGDELSYSLPPLEMAGVKVTNHLVWKRVE